MEVLLCWHVFFPNMWHRNNNLVRSLKFHGISLHVLIQMLTEWLLQNFAHGIWTLILLVMKLEPGPWFNIKMASYQYRKSHCGDKTILRLSYLHNGISYTGKMTSLYWIRAQVNTMGVDALASGVTRSSATIEFAMQGRWALDFHEQGFQLPMLYQCSKMQIYLYLSNFQIN